MNRPARVRDLRKRVLIVDDHPLLREGITAVINSQADLIVCGDAVDVPGALSALAAGDPDVVLTDLSLTAGSGLDLIRRIRRRRPDVPVLVLTIHSEDHHAEEALRAGARGYVMKRETADVVLAAIRKVLRGQVAVSAHVLERLTRDELRADAPWSGRTIERLTGREEEIYRCLGAGLGTGTIATKLGIAVSTVESHRARIKEKLGLRNAPELVSSAARFMASEGKDEDSTDGDIALSAIPEWRIPRYAAARPVSTLQVQGRERSPGGRKGKNGRMSEGRKP